MKASDTVMPIEYFVEAEAKNKSRIIVAQDQAEISFKAGIQEVVKWIEEQGYYSLCDPCECLTNNKGWQSKLKEWGLE